MKILSVILATAFILGILTPVCFAQSQDDGAKKVLKEGILGAGVGAIAAGASGGKAGKGALIGAGANIAGEAIMGALTSQPQPAQQVQQMPPQAVQSVPVQQIQTVTPYQQGYEAGYQKGFQDGYDKGYSAGLAAASTR
jgi:hypothetical protein